MSIGYIFLWVFLSIVVYRVEAWMVFKIIKRNRRDRQRKRLRSPFVMDDWDYRHSYFCPNGHGGIYCMYINSSGCPKCHNALTYIRDIPAYRMEMVARGMIDA